MKRSFLFTLLLLWVGVLMAQGSVKITLINGVWYQLHQDKNVAVIIKSPYKNIKISKKAAKKQLVIPEVVSDLLVEEKTAYRVIGIDGGAFKGNDLITEVELPESILFIDNIAFMNCSKLKKITLPSNLKFLGDGAFAACKSLQSIVIPDSLQQIGSGAFDKCKKLKSMEWNAINCTLKPLTQLSPSSDTAYIPPFHSCPKLSSLTFGEKVEHIPSYLLYGNPSVKEIDLPETVIGIGEFAFAYCKKLKIARFKTSFGARAEHETWFVGSPTDVESVLMPGETIHMSGGSCIINTKVEPDTNQGN